MQFRRFKEISKRCREAGIERIFHIISIFIMGTLLLSLGPSLQQHAVALIVSQEPSFYSSVYKDTLINFPSFRDWLFAQSLIPFAAGSLAITAALLYSKTTRGAFIITAVIGFLFWMILDSYNIFIGHTYSGFFECLISNIIGSCIYASIFTVILCISQKFKSSTSEHILAVQFVRIATPATIGVLLVLLQYYILTLIFNPAPANVDIKLTADSQLRYTFDSKTKENYKNEKKFCCETEEKKEVPNLKTFDGSFAGEFSFTGMTKKAKINWIEENKDYKVLISVYDGCLTSDVNKLQQRDWLALQRNKLSNFQLQPDDGHLDILTNSQSGRIDIPDVKSGLIWINKSETEGKVDLTKLIADQNIINYWANGNPLSFTLRLPLLNADKNARLPKSRKISIKLGEEKVNLIFNPPEPSKILETCKQLNTSQRKQDYNLDTNTILITLVIKITKPNLNWFESYNDSIKLKLSGLNGWSNIAKIDSSEMGKLFKTGLVQSIDFKGNIKDFYINGEEISNTQGKWFSLYETNILGQVEQEADAIKLSGLAKYIWVDQKRLSKTRWENLDGATQAILLSVFGSLLLAFVIFLNKCWRDDEGLTI